MTDVGRTSKGLRDASPAAQARRRPAGWWGWAFTCLLLLIAGMASVPGGAAPVDAVRAFYTGNTAVVVVAQLLGLGAAAAFVAYVRALRRSTDARPAGLVPSGWLVAVAATATAVPVLWLTAAAAGGRDALVHGLAVASDLTDVALFVAVAGFAAVIARAGAGRPVRAFAAGVALVALARAVLLLLSSSALQVVAPVLFVLLVAVTSTLALLGRPVLRAGTR